MPCGTLSSKCLKMEPKKQLLNFNRNSKKPKLPITQNQYQRIRNSIRKTGGRFASRNLLLVNLQTNSCINSSDVLKFKTGTVFREGRIIDKFWINQKKLSKSQLVTATRAIRSDIEAVIKDYSMMFYPEYFNDPNNPLFPSQRIDKETGYCKAMSYSAYRSFLQRIFAKLNMNLDLYGTHSLRSALPQAYYWRTGDVKGAKALYDHRSGRTTITYIEEVSARKAIEIKRELQFSD